MPKSTGKTKKQFVRNTKDGVVAGVCAGIADYFNVDVAVVRLIWVFLLVPGGLPGLIPYILLWIVMPAKQN